MAHLFKPVVIRYRLPNGKAVRKGTPGAQKVRERTKKWYGSYEDADGMPVRKPLCARQGVPLTLCWASWSRRPIVKEPAIAIRLKSIASGR